MADSWVLFTRVSFIGINESLCLIWEEEIYLILPLPTVL